MEFGTLKTEVESWLLDLPPGASSRVGGWINEAIAQGAKRYNFRFMEAEISPSPTVTTTQQRKLVDKPSDWKESRSLPYLIHQDGSTSEIDWGMSKSDMVRTYAEKLPDEDSDAAADDGQPRYILVQPDELHVYPLPDDESDWNNGRYRVVIPYWAYPAALVNDTDSNAFTDDATYYCLWKAVELGLKWNRDFETARAVRQDAEVEFQRFMREDRLAQLPDRFSLRPRKDVYGGRPRGTGPFGRLSWSPYRG